MRRDEYREPTDALHRLRANQLQMDRDIEREVWDLRCRMVPVPWSQIGAALGVSKQGAQQRFGHLDHTEQPDLYDELTA